MLTDFDFLFLSSIRVEKCVIHFTFLTPTRTGAVAARGPWNSECIFSASSHHGNIKKTKPKSGSTIFSLWWASLFYFSLFYLFLFYKRGKKRNHPIEEGKITPNYRWETKTSVDWTPENVLFTKRQTTRHGILSVSRFFLLLFFIFSIKLVWALVDSFFSFSFLFGNWKHFTDNFRERREPAGRPAPVGRMASPIRHTRRQSQQVLLIKIRPSRFSHTTLKGAEILQVVWLLLLLLLDEQVRIH